MVIYDSTFTEVMLDTEKSLVSTSWFETSVKLNNEGVMKEMQAILDAALPYRPVAIIADTRRFFVKVNQELQSWIVLNFISRLIDAGVKRYAIIVPERVFPYLSKEVISENTIEGFEIQYFIDDKSAIEWTLNALSTGQ